ncbi:MAG: DUF2834 domain-containing protein [Opitutales bacterium]|nr:DUF2834 domain-containing protein [Opitutales bacterium]NRA26040.1 DUF2834 domain-containing protein [Opitutales bacterium]
MRAFYVILCVLGVILPYSVIVPWSLEQGVNLAQFWSELTANRISIFAWLDVSLAAVVLVAFIITEGRRLGMTRLWLPIASIFTVGVCLGFPLFLLMRHKYVSQEMNLAREI